MTPVKYIPAPPVGPGEVLRKHILSANITQDHLAKAMMVSRFSISQIINGRRSITAEMALRLARVTSTTPSFWLNLQRQMDLYEANLRLAPVLDQLQILRQPKLDRELFVDVDD